MALKLSIITICRNAGKDLEKTISSVIEQTYQNVEYVFIDGLSSDQETIDIINRRKKEFTIFTSEKDSGIYDAMNKGIAAASGDILLFINAGDRLADPYSVEAAMKLIESKQAMIYFADVVWVDTLKKVVRSGIPEINYASDFSSGNYTHSGTFYTRECFAEYGFFDTNYKVLADFEMNLRLLVKNNLPFTVLNVLVSVFYTGGISTSSAGKELRDKEMTELKSKYSLSDSTAKKSLFSGKIRKNSSRKLNRIY